MKPHYLNYTDVIRKNAEHEHAGRRDDVIQILTPDFYDIFNYVEKNMDRCMKSQSMARIKKYYWQNKDRVRERRRVYRIRHDGDGDGDEYTHHLAVHIRRPNCDDTRPNSGEEYDNAYYIRSMLKIQDDNRSQRIQFHIYSQGSDERFTDFTKHSVIGRDVMLHLNENNEDTYLGMTLADILITSASSYSYSAAFFCDGEIYYTEFWHQPCSWWKKLPKS